MFKKDRLKRRILMTILGVTVCGFSVGFFTHAMLGLDPFQVFAHGVWSLTPIDFGTFYVILNKYNPDPSLPVRFGSLAVGVVVMCFASAFYFTADLGVSTYDAIAITISERHPKLQFRFIRITTDLICVITGWALGANVGIGTIITAFFMGPLIAFFNKTAAEPVLNRPYNKKGE